MTTREKKSRYWTPALKRILTALLEVDRAKFSGPGPTETLTVEFPPSVQPTLMELGQTAMTLKTAQAASTETLVRMVHPDWDKTQIDDEVTRILTENAMTVPDIGPLPGDGEDFDDAPEDGADVGSDE